MSFPPQNQMPQSPMTDPKLAVRTMQIICAALMLGVLMFAGIAVFQRLGQPAAARPMIAYIGIGMAAMMIVTRLVFVPFIVRDGIKQVVGTRPIEDLTKLDFYRVYQTQMIVACALCEGAAFFNLISYIIEGQLWSLAIVAGLLAIMAMAFPTMERVDSWADEQLRLTRLSPPN